MAGRTYALRKIELDRSMARRNEARRQLVASLPRTMTERLCRCRTPIKVGDPVGEKIGLRGEVYACCSKCVLLPDEMHEPFGIRERLPFVVGRNDRELLLAPDGHSYVSLRFATEDEAAEFLGSLQDQASVEAGEFYLDGPEEV